MSKLPQFKTILYVTDLGARTRPVFLHALSVARAFGANVVMLHVVEPLGSAAETALAVYLTEEQRLRFEQEGLHSILGRMRQRLKTFCEEEQELAAVEQSLVSDVVVAHGSADEQIIAEAQKYGADLIVIGSTTDGNHLLGSTARRVTQHSSIPVLVVPNV